MLLLGALVRRTSLAQARRGIKVVPKMNIIFTCSVCDTRSAKTFTKNAYENGVVLVQCPGCEKYHLIADRLGWFEEGGWDVNSLGATKIDQSALSQDDKATLTDQLSPKSKEVDTDLIHIETSSLLEK